MKVLIAGNSHLACLKKAHDMNPDVLGKHGEIYFFVTPGGTGPYLSIEDDRLVVNKNQINPDFPPRVYPDEAAQLPVSYYDAIVVSALGYIDGGFLYPTVNRQGVLSDFMPKSNQITNRLLSKGIYKHIINQSLDVQPGVSFLKQLRKFHKGKIIVQPYPLISDAIRVHPEWPFNIMYHDPLRAHAFFSNARDTFLQQLCHQLAVELLPYPNEEWHRNMFTPAEFMNPLDGLHADERYGSMVVNQIDKCLLV